MAVLASETTATVTAADSRITSLSRQGRETAANNLWGLPKDVSTIWISISVYSFRSALEAKHSKTGTTRRTIKCHPISGRPMFVAQLLFTNM